jgi:methionine aminopeptidase
LVLEVLTQLLKECTPGKKIVDICLLGDKLINDAVGAIYTKGKIEKGVAFPTSISVNNCAGHFSPLVGDAAELQEGDLAKM